MVNNKTAVIEEMKELLSDPKNRIRLDDYIAKHVKAFLVATDLEHFPVQGIGAEKENFLERMQKYEEIAKDLQQIVIFLARWGEQEQLLLLGKVFSRLAEADKGSAGTVFGWYPLMLLMYTAGIAALSERKYGALKIILETQVRFGSEHGNETMPVIIPVISKLTGFHDEFKLLPGHEKHYVPRSEHLFKFLQPLLEDLLFLGRNYESLFDRFEIFLALIYADTMNRDWGPPGRFAWKYSSPIRAENPFTALIEEAGKYGDKWAPLKAGFFQGSYKRFQEIADSYKKRLDKLSWW